MAAKVQATVDVERTVVVVRLQLVTERTRVKVVVRKTEVVTVGVAVVVAVS